MYPYNSNDYRFAVAVSGKQMESVERVSEGVSWGKSD